jgi:hypothetical protein
MVRPLWRDHWCRGEDRRSGHGRSLPAEVAGEPFVLPRGQPRRGRGPGRAPSAGGARGSGRRFRPRGPGLPDHQPRPRRAAGGAGHRAPGDRGGGRRRRAGRRRGRGRVQGRRPARDHPGRAGQRFRPHAGHPGPAGGGGPGPARRPAARGRPDRGPVRRRPRAGGGGQRLPRRPLRGRGDRQPELVGPRPGRLPAHRGVRAAGLAPRHLHGGPGARGPKGRGPGGRASGAGGPPGRRVARGQLPRVLRRGRQLRLPGRGQAGRTRRRHRRRAARCDHDEPGQETVIRRGHAAGRARRTRADGAGDNAAGGLRDGHGRPAHAGRRRRRDAGLRRPARGRRPAAHPGPARRPAGHRAGRRPGLPGERRGSPAAGAAGGSVKDFMVPSGMRCGVV